MRLTDEPQVGTPSSLSLDRFAIIGRPNVGKSTLFNRLTRTRQALVKDEPGVTRDVQEERAEWWGRTFTVLDTGGLTDRADVFSPLIREKVEAELAHVTGIIVVLDGRAGLTPEDRDVLRLAQQSGKDFLVVVNKVDRFQEEDLVLSDFYELGVDLMGSSFEQGRAIDQIVEWCLARLPEESAGLELGIKLAVVGKPNVGKSSLCNRLLGESRYLVSEKAGTTVDAVSSSFVYDDKTYTLVDTAGLRRQARRRETDDGVEILSAFKTEGAITHADVVLLVIDAVEGPTEQDAKILDLILQNHKAVIVVANKADLATEERPRAREWFREQIAQHFHFFPDVNIVFTCAITGAGLSQLFAKVQEVWEKLHFRIPTSKLNDFFFAATRGAPAPVYGTQNVKFYYLTQTGQTPPSFIAFANYPAGVTPSYRRFLINRIQDHWGLSGIPVRLFVMKKS